MNFWDFRILRNSIVLSIVYSPIGVLQVETRSCSEQMELEPINISVNM